MDFNRMIRKLGNREIVNKKIIHLEDRNIDNIVINCYSNLKNTKLAAYSMDYADNSTEFKCEYKAQLDKMKSKYKKTKSMKADDDRDCYEDMLKTFDTSEFISIDNIHNNFKILKLKYISDPMSFNAPLPVKIALIDSTLRRWKEETKEYYNIQDDTIEYLQILKQKYLDELGVVSSRGIDPTEYDLFIKEQLVLIPIYEGDSKYTINGVKYYGVFNNCDIGVLTKNGTFSFKVFKGGNIFTMYMKEDKGVIICNYFGNPYNLFHILTDKPALSTPMEEIFPKTDNELLLRLFDNTYRHAQMLERKDPLLKEMGVKASIPEPSKNGFASATFADKSYRAQVSAAVLAYGKQRANPNEARTRSFEFLGKLEEGIYSELSQKSLKRTITIKSDEEIGDIKRRVNLSPNTIMSVIKKGSSDDESNLLFTSTSTEPNPFDIYYVFAFMRTTIHTNTKEKRGKNVPALQESEKYIKWTDPEYLGEFAPKSESNIGRATTLNFSIDSKNIIERKTLS